MSKIRIPFVLIAHILFIIAVYILQGLVFTYIPIQGTVPVLLPIAAVGIATFEGSAKGGGYGLLAGMLCDISFNQPVIIMTVTLTVVGIVAGLLGETVMARGFPTYFLGCLGALVLTAFVSFFSLLFFNSVDVRSLLTTAGRQTLYSMIFAIPMYFIVRALGRRSAAE